jgi:hypothetical protein
MVHITTVLVTMSRMLSDLVMASVAGEIVLDIVAEFETRDFLGEKLSALAPNLVLVGLSYGEADKIGRSLLKLLPDAKVITFSSDLRSAYVHQMRPTRAVITDVSRSSLIRAIVGPKRRRAVEGDRSDPQDGRLKK